MPSLETTNLSALGLTGVPVSPSATRGSNTNSETTPVGLHSQCQRLKQCPVNNQVKVTPPWPLVQHVIEQLHGRIVVLSANHATNGSMPHARMCRPALTPT